MQDSPQVIAIRERYKASFVEKVAMIDAHIKSVEVDDVSDQTLELVHGELHKLAGSLGMYSYDDMALVARAGMQAITEKNASGLLTDLQKLRDMLVSAS